MDAELNDIIQHWTDSGSYSTGYLQASKSQDLLHHPLMMRWGCGWAIEKEMENTEKDGSSIHLTVSLPLQHEHTHTTYVSVILTGLTEWGRIAKKDVNPLLREYLLPHWLHTSRAAHPSDPWRPVTVPQTGLSLTHTSRPLRRSRGDGFKRDTLWSLRGSKEGTIKLWHLSVACLGKLWRNGLRRTARVSFPALSPSYISTPSHFFDSFSISKISERLFACTKSVAVSILSNFLALPKEPHREQICGRLDLKEVKWSPLAIWFHP